MELTINHPEINQLAHELMSYTNETLSQILLNALKERLKREKEKVIDIAEAQKRFMEIISLVQAGTDIILSQNNQPVVRLTPLSPNSVDSSPRVLGLHDGEGWISDDFNEPLPDEFWLGQA
jgi:prevent-host-death family protein